MKVVSLTTEGHRYGQKQPPCISLGGYQIQSSHFSSEHAVMSHLALLALMYNSQREGMLIRTLAFTGCGSVMQAQVSWSCVCDTKPQPLHMVLLTIL